MCLIKIDLVIDLTFNDWQISNDCIWWSLFFAITLLLLFLHQCWLTLVAYHRQIAGQFSSTLRRGVAAHVRLGCLQLAPCPHPGVHQITTVPPLKHWWTSDELWLTMVNCSQLVITVDKLTLVMDNYSGHSWRNWLTRSSWTMVNYSQLWLALVKS